LRAPSKKPGWLEDSKNISDELPLSKRELFSLILLAHARSSEGMDWLVGYDANDPEPNDGYITDGNSKLNIESKIATQFAKPDARQEMIDRFKAVDWKGKGYGLGRCLAIYVNRESRGLVKVSDLTDEITREGCSFDMVLSIYCVSMSPKIVMHITQHCPKLREAGITEIIFNFKTGEAVVPLHKIQFNN